MRSSDVKKADAGVAGDEHLLKHAERRRARVAAMRLSRKQQRDGQIGVGKALGQRTDPPGLGGERQVGRAGALLLCYRHLSFCRRGGCCRVPGGFGRLRGGDVGGPAIVLGPCLGGEGRALLLPREPSGDRARARPRRQPRRATGGCGGPFVPGRRLRRTLLDGCREELLFLAGWGRGRGSPPMLGRLEPAATVELAALRPDASHPAAASVRWRWTAARRGRPRASPAAAATGGSAPRGRPRRSARGDRVTIEGEQAGGTEAVDHRGSPDRHRAPDRHAAPGVLGALARRDEPAEHAAGRRPARRSVPAT